MYRTNHVGRARYTHLHEPVISRKQGPGATPVHMGAALGVLHYAHGQRAGQGCRGWRWRHRYHLKGHSGYRWLVDVQWLLHYSDLLN